jgi:lauroyl/myristoyl acyltransferase
MSTGAVRGESSPLLGRLAYRLLPIRRRIVRENLRRVFGASATEDELVRLAEASYAHLARSLGEILAFALRPDRAERRVRLENVEAALRAAERGKGLLVLTGHFGNWEVATVAGIASFPEYRGRFHVLRRPLRPAWLDRLVVRRFRRAGLGVIPKKGGLATVLERLEAQDAVVFVLDQWAAPRDAVAADFFGHPAPTFKSLAIVALATGAPVVPAASFRDRDGVHVLRFEEALPAIDHADPGEAIRANTQAYNRALEELVLRHPEQWFWLHRRWK